MASSNAILAGLGQGMQTFGGLQMAKYQFDREAADRSEDRALRREQIDREAVDRSEDRALRREQIEITREQLQIASQQAATANTNAAARLEELKRQGDIAQGQLDLAASGEWEPIEKTISTKDELGNMTSEKVVVGYYNTRTGEQQFTGKDVELPGAGGDTGGAGANTAGGGANTGAGGANTGSVGGANTGSVGGANTGSVGGADTGAVPPRAEDKSLLDYLPGGENIGFGGMGDAKTKADDSAAPGKPPESYADIQQLEKTVKHIEQKLIPTLQEKLKQAAMQGDQAQISQWTNQIQTQQKLANDLKGKLKQPSTRG